MSELGVLDPDLYANGNPWHSSLPLELFDELREERPCYWQPLDAEPMFVDGVWVVSRYADVVAVIRDTARFSNKAGISVRRFDPTRAECGGKPTMMSMDGIEHRNNRTVTNRMLSRKAVSAYAAKFRTIAATLVAAALERGTVDFITDIACYMPLHAVSELLGIPDEDREQVLAWTNLITVPLDAHFTPTQADFEQALDGLWRYGLKLSDRRLAQPDQSVMSAIAQGHAEGVLSDDEVSGYMLALAAAGNETTRNAIAIGLHALLQRPEQMALLRAQGGAMPESAIEEILRWASPAIHTVRLAKADFSLHGQTIRAGDRVALLLSSANFDPAQFDGPESFDILRAANDHVAFGTAAHTCLGLHVARLELKILFEELLRQTSAIELAGEVGFIRDNLVHGIRTMPIRISGQA